MKLSLLTFSFMGDVLTHRMDAETLCRIAKENGIEELDLQEAELRLYGVKALKKAFANSGVRCGCLIAALPFCQGVERYTASLEKAFKACETIGADKLMITAGIFDTKVCKQLHREEQLRRVIELFTIASERGQEYGIEILFEDAPQPYKPLSSSTDCRAILDAVPGLGFVFDTANFLVAEPDCNILTTWEMLKNRVRRVHLKDVVRGNIPRAEVCQNGESILTVATGSGIIPLRPFVEKLKADGYDGVCCVEYMAKAGVHGEEHSLYLDTYVRNIRAYWEGEEIRPPYGTIPGLDKPVSRIFFGTAIRPMLTGRDVNALLDAVLALGINAFDCARGYGLAEKSLGKWIRERNNRDKIVLLTKCGNVNLKGEVCVNRTVILSEMEKSLKTLDVDYIDIYLLHRDDPNTPVSEIIDTLNECKQKGKIRVFGVSNWTHERIAEANAYAESRGLEGFSVSSPNYGLAHQICDPWGGGCVTVTGPENAGARAWYAANQMPLIAYSSLARGFFSGKFKAFDYEGAERVLDGPGQKGYLCEENMKRLKNAEILAEKYGTSVTDIALRYLFGSDMNVYAVMSTTNPRRLPGNVAAANHPLGREEISFLDNNE